MTPQGAHGKWPCVQTIYCILSQYGGSLCGLAHIIVTPFQKSDSFIINLLHLYKKQSFSMTTTHFALETVIKSHGEPNLA